MRITVSYLTAIAVASICVQATTLGRVQEEGQEVLPQLKIPEGKLIHLRLRFQRGPKDVTEFHLTLPSHCVVTDFSAPVTSDFFTKLDRSIEVAADEASRPSRQPTTRRPTQPKPTRRPTKRRPTRRPTASPSMLETVIPKYSDITAEPSESPTYAPNIPKHGGIFRPVTIIFDTAAPTILETVNPKYNEVTLEPSYAPVIIPHGGIHYPVTLVLPTRAPTVLETVNPKYNEITLEPTYKPVVIPHGGVFRPVPPFIF